MKSGDEIRVLNQAAKMLDVNYAVSIFKKDFEDHPLPLSLNSLEFNWQYIKDHGVENFYSITSNYLDKMASRVSSARDKFNSEITASQKVPTWMTDLNIQMMEIPAHCSVCKKSIGMIYALAQAIES